MCLATFKRVDFDVVHAKHILIDLVRSSNIELEDAYFDVVFANANVNS